jgi:hypothetical protein
VVHQQFGIKLVNAANSLLNRTITSALPATSEASSQIGQNKIMSCISGVEILTTSGFGL